MKTSFGTLFSFCILASSILLVTAEDSPKTKPAATDPTTEKTAAPAAKADTASNFHTICYLERQDCTITVKAGEKGTVYSVKRADGKTLCENVSLEQLRAQAPELHQFIKSALALSGKGLDARLEAPRLDARN